MSKAKTVGRAAISVIIAGIILIGLVMLSIAGICSVDGASSTNNPLHGLSSLCQYLGWIIPNKF